MKNIFILPVILKDSSNLILDELAEQYALEKQNEDTSKYYIALEAFKKGFEAHQKRSYTYEEMKESFSKGHDSARLKGSYKSNESFEEDWESWSNQFKKEPNKESGATQCWSERELYITSDEEIKEGDWCLDTLNLILFVSDGRVNVHQNTDKKIILTTDQDLIKEGVQAIDDEFLEWFIKNQNCEYVEIIEQYRKCCRNTDGKNENCIEPINCEGWLNNKYERPYKTNCEERFEGYKIIIPKEEPNLDKHLASLPEYPGPRRSAFVSKQEILEEAAEKYWSRQPYNEDPFVEGVKWQQERSYSREEVLFQLNLLYSMKSSTLDTFTDEKDMITMNWFKQFKEK